MNLTTLRDIVCGRPRMSDKEIVDRLAYYFARREPCAAKVSLLMRLFGRKWHEVYEILRERDW